MELLLEKIDKYLLTQEKKEAIDLSQNSELDLFNIIKIVKSIEDKESFLSTLDEEMREQIKKLIDGGIL